MKRASLFILTCVAASTVMAQTKQPVPPKTVAKTASKTTTPGKTATGGATFRNASDSFSYALGLSIANFYKQQGVTGINNDMVLRALNDAKVSKPKFNEQQVNACIMDYMQTARSKKSSGAKKAGEAFLAANKNKPGIITLPSGLQYQVITEGTGPKPTINDQVKCHYTGSFVDGKVFESSYNNGQPITFAVGGVIKGWTEALLLMPVGSKYKLFIPSELGYGDGDNGPIAGGSTLIFEVELLEIAKQ